MAIAPVNKFVSIAVPVSPGLQKLYEVPTGTSALLLYTQVSNVGIGVTRASTDDVKLMKNVPIPQGSSFEFMAGNKVVLETTDTLTAESDVNNSLDVALTIMEIT